MKLKIVVSTASATLQTNGEIYEESHLTSGPPAVSDVVAAEGKVSYFSLDSGKYVYDFAIQDGKGSVTVSVQNAASGVTLASDTFDTKYGYFANDLPFVVP